MSPMAPLVRDVSLMSLLPSYPWCFVGEAGFDQWRPCDEDRAALGNR